VFAWPALPGGEFSQLAAMKHDQPGGSIGKGMAGLPAALDHGVEAGTSVSPCSKQLFSVHFVYSVV